MFEPLIGNNRVKEILRRMLAARRVSGALLFAGIEGIGKKRFALELAKALNCRSPKNFEACDACSSCQRIQNSRFPDHDTDDANKKKIIWSEHADVALVRPFNKIIRVPTMRDLEREANFRPYEGAARLFIIEDADKLNEESSNALLKTLEEPPPTTHLVLVTSRPDALLPTIRSRCQTLRFEPLDAGVIEEHLSRTQTPAKKNASAPDARLRARAAQGSIGRALSLDLESYLSQRELMLGVLVALTIEPDRARLLRVSEELTDPKRKDEYEPRLDVLVTLIHDAWSLSLGAPRERVVNVDLLEQLARIGSRLESRRAADWLARIEQHRLGLAVNINRKVATDALLLGMAASSVDKVMTRRAG
jgi:DNA polymerase III subunit delta'